MNKKWRGETTIPGGEVARQWQERAVELGDQVVELSKERDRLLEQARAYNLALRAIATLRTVYLEEWDATVEAGLDDAKDIAKQALKRRKR